MREARFWYLEKQGPSQSLGGKGPTQVETLGWGSGSESSVGLVFWLGYHFQSVLKPAKEHNHCILSGYLTPGERQSWR